MSPVVAKADAVSPRLTREWLEYAQARGFVTDPARVRHPRDKPRVEAGVKYVQGNFWLPPDGLAFLAQQDQALLGIEVLRAQRQRAAPAAGGLGVQAQQQRVQLRVITRGRRRVVDLGQALAGDRPPRRGRAARLLHLPGRVLIPGDEAVFLGVLVHAAQGGDEVLGGAAPAA